MTWLFRDKPNEQKGEWIAQHILWPMLRDIYPYLTRGSEQRPGHVWMADSEYWVPVKRDVEWWLADDNTDRPPWLANARDCDNFSERLWHGHDLERDNLIKAGELTGERALQWPLFRCWVRKLKGKTTNHAVNLIYCVEGWHWIEPQTDGIWPCDKDDRPYYIY